MKHIFPFLAAVLLAWSCATPRAENERFIPKGQKALTQWSFSKDGQSWENVTVPHSYNGIDGRSASYYRGPATYRTSVDIADPDAPAFLIFEGAAQAATVQVNGRPACSHKGGYTACTVPLAGLLQKGQNQIEVVCDNTEDIEKQGYTKL